MRHSRLLAIAILAVVLVSGCRPGGWWQPDGTARQPASRILERSKAAAFGAHTVRVQGRLLSAGQSVTIDMHFVTGTGGSGVINIGGRTIELMRRGQDVYLKGSDAYYQSIGIRALPAKLRGKYLKFRADDTQFAGLVYFTDMRKVLTAVLTPSGPVSRGKKTKVNGTRAIALTVGGNSRTLYVATEGQPFPLRLTAPRSATESGSIDFGEYNWPFTVPAPAAAGVVDINKLTKAAR